MKMEWEDDTLLFYGVGTEDNRIENRFSELRTKKNTQDSELDAVINGVENKQKMELDK